MWIIRANNDGVYDNYVWWGNFVIAVCVETVTHIKIKILYFIFQLMVAVVTHSRIIDLKFQKKYDLLNMPGVNHSLSTASMLSGSMRSVAGQQHIRAMSSQRLYASRQSLQHGHSQRSLNRSQQSLNINRGAAANF